MAEEKKEKWLNYLALISVILVVCATLSTFKGGVVFHTLGPQPDHGIGPVGILPGEKCERVSLRDSEGRNWNLG